jgi:hypothetical protein
MEQWRLLRVSRLSRCGSLCRPGGPAASCGRRKGAALAARVMREQRGRDRQAGTGLSGAACFPVLPCYWHRQKARSGSAAGQELSSAGKPAAQRGRLLGAWCQAVWRSIQACTSRSFHRKCLPIRYACSPHSRHLSRTVRSGRPELRRHRGPTACGWSRPECRCGAERAAARRGVTCRGPARQAVLRSRGLRCAQVYLGGRGTHGHRVFRSPGLWRGLPVARHLPGHPRCQGRRSARLFAPIPRTAAVRALAAPAPTVRE